MRQWICRRFPGFVRRLNAVRLPEMVKRVETALRPGDRVLDVGAGTCLFVELLRARGCDVTPLDVVDCSAVPAIAPLLYDGRKIPAADDAYDVALIAFVLHHTPDPDAVLREAARVARRLIVMEDLLDGRLHGAFTKIWDSVLNLEFFGHPHSNRSDEGWRSTFAALGLAVEKTDRYRSMGFRHGVYCLCRLSKSPDDFGAGVRAPGPAKYD